MRIFLEQGDTGWYVKGAEIRSITIAELNVGTCTSGKQYYNYKVYNEDKSDYWFIDYDAVFPSKESLIDKLTKNEDPFHEKIINNEL